MSYNLQAENASVRPASNNPILVILTLFVLGASRQASDERSMVVWRRFSKKGRSW
jgi:hypothetical protein